MHWFIQPDVLRELEAARRSGIFKVTLDELQAFEKALQEERQDEAAAPRNLRIAGSEAEILIEGPLVKRSMFMFFLFGRGQTVYQDIQDALAVAEQDASIRRVTLRIDSPGGTVDGFFDTLAALESFSKPVTAKVINAHSAAYGIAAMARRIEATSPASMVGSVGVATSFFFFGDEEIVDLTNTGSPDKRPDVRTEEGKAVIVRELDAVAELMADAISRGRKSAGKPVKSSELFEKFGRGASFLAGEAKRRGMIDVAPSALRTTRAASASDDEQVPVAELVRGYAEAVKEGFVTRDRAAREEPGDEGKSQEATASGNPAEGGKERAMDITTLKALRREYPDLCDELHEEGVKKGADQERERVAAHLTYGQSAGEQGLKIALKAIEEGTEVNQLVIAKYMTAAKNDTDASARSEEGKETAAAVAGASEPATAGEGGSSEQPDMGDQVVKILGWDKPNASTEDKAAAQSAG